MTTETTTIVDQAIQEIEQNLKAKSRNPITTWDDFKKHVFLRFTELEREQFGVYFLNQQNFLIEFRMIHQGGILDCQVSTREVIRQALLLNATAILLAHNHTSGFVEPSRSDDSITMSIIKAAELFDIRVLDHAIAGGNDVYSYAASGRLSKLIQYS